MTIYYLYQCSNCKKIEALPIFVGHDVDLGIHYTAQEELSPGNDHESCGFGSIENKRNTIFAYIGHLSL
jgi:hypothetical protein